MMAGTAVRDAARVVACGRHEPVVGTQGPTSIHVDEIEQSLGDATSLPRCRLGGDRRVFRFLSLAATRQIDRLAGSRPVGARRVRLSAHACRCRLRRASLRRLRRCLHRVVPGVVVGGRGRAGRPLGSCRRHPLPARCSDHSVGTQNGVGRARLPLHQPRHGGRRADQPPDRGDAARRDRRDRIAAWLPRGSAPPVHTKAHRGGAGAGSVDATRTCGADDREDRQPVAALPAFALARGGRATR